MCAGCAQYIVWQRKWIYAMGHTRLVSSDEDDKNACKKALCVCANTKALLKEGKYLHSASHSFGTKVYTR